MYVKVKWHNRFNSALDFSLGQGRQLEYCKQFKFDSGFLFSASEKKKCSEREKKDKDFENVYRYKPF